MAVVYFPDRGDTMLPRTKKIRARVGDIIADNFRYFFNKQWRQAEPKGKTVENIAKGLSKPTLPSLELVADRAKIPVWYLFLPLSEDLLESTEIDDLIYSYINLSPEKREVISNTIQILNSK